MTLALKSFATVPEAASALAETGARYLAGGTLVVRAANEGDLSLGTFVRATDPALASIAVANGVVTLGASVTMAALVRHPELVEVGKAARSIGGPAVRNMATVGGNLFAPAPYGDFAVALLALDATVISADQQAPIGEFLASRDSYTGIVTAVRFDLPTAGSFRFAKVSRIKPKGVSVLSIAAVIGTAANGEVSSARIALGCLADRPMRARAAETALIGETLTETGIAKALAVVGEGTSPITDPIASGWYRGEVLAVHFKRLLLG